MKVLNISKFSSKLSSTNNLSQSVPQVKRPILAYFEPLRLHKHKQLETKNQGLFSGLKEAFTSVVEITVPSVKLYKEVQVLKQQAIQKQEERAAKDVQELFDLREECKSLDFEYERLFGLRLERLPILATPVMLTQRITLMKEKIAHERMLQDLESTYTKGANYFCPNRVSKIRNFSFYSLVPNNNKEYKSELKNLCEIYLKNSSELEPALREFNDITRNFFTHAAACLKEIFDLKKELFSRIGERLPVVGIIPKAIRVDEQVRLSKCVLKDFEDVSDVFVKNGMINIFNKYSEQYNIIKNYVENSKKRDISL